MAFSNTLDDEFKGHLSSVYMDDITTKQELMDRLDQVMLKKIPTHSRRIQALSEAKKHNETSSMYFKRLEVLYKQSDIPSMAWTNLLANLGLLKLPEAECFRDIRKLVSKGLSSSGRDKNFQVTELISQMEAIEAERIATGLSNLQSNRNNNNKANRIQSSNRGEGRCFICGSISRTKEHISVQMVRINRPQV